MQVYNCSFIWKPLHSEQIVSASSLQGCNCTYKNIIHTQDFQYKECNDSYTYECLHFKYKARLFSSDNYAIILDMVYCVMDTRAYWLHSSLWGAFIEPLSYIVSVSLFLALFLTVSCFSFSLTSSQVTYHLHHGGTGRRGALLSNSCRH